MTGDMNTLFMEIVKMMIDWGKDISKFPQNWSEIINRFNLHLRTYTACDSVCNLPEFIRLISTNTIKDLGFDVEELHDLKLLNQHGLVDQTIQHWYEDAIAKDNGDQAMVQDFLVKCRQAYQETNNPRIMEMYSKVRAFINPRHYAVTQIQLQTLINQYRHDFPWIGDIDAWYESGKSIQSGSFQCPHCGRILPRHELAQSPTCKRQCQYTMDLHNLYFKETEFDQDRFYRILKHGIYTYTLIPGISERRLFDALEERFGDSMAVTLYPFIDEFDLMIESVNGCIFLDVKDYANPKQLAEKINEASTVKKMTNQGAVFYVIPNHHKSLYTIGDYRDVVRGKVVDKSLRKRIIYESEVEGKVGDL